MGINVLSLFDGISCGRVALEKANIQIDKYYASEVEPRAIQIANKNYPTTIHIGDIQKVTYKGGVLQTEKGEFNVGAIDLVIGGSPCQNFSFAGTQKGMCTSTDIKVTTLQQYLQLKKEGWKFEGQSYLFWEYIRLLKEINPTHFLLENVKMGKEWEDVITKGIGVQPVLINSNLFSAQNRQRYYWTNIEIPALPQDNSSVLRDIVREEDNKEEYYLSEQHYKAFLKSYKWKGSDLGGKSKPILASYYKQPPHSPYIPCSLSPSGFRLLSPIECERLQTLPDNYTEGVSKSARYKCIGNGWTVDVIAHILSGLKG